MDEPVSAVQERLDRITVLYALALAAQIATRIVSSLVAS